MWTEIHDYDYASVPEGHVDLMIVPATNPGAQMLRIQAQCEHYNDRGVSRARFKIKPSVGGGVSYLDLADYCPTHWCQLNTNTRERPEPEELPQCAFCGVELVEEWERDHGSCGVGSCG